MDATPNVGGHRWVDAGQPQAYAKRTASHEPEEASSRGSATKLRAETPRKLVHSNTPLSARCCRARWLECALLVEQRFQLTPIVDDPADHHATIPVKKIHKWRQSYVVIALGPARRINDHSGTQLRCLSEGAAVRAIALADHKPVELRSPGSHYLGGL